MKYKILLLGSNKRMIDEFFMQMDNVFECLTTSSRFEDIVKHVQYFQPDLIIYCLKGEKRDDVTRMIAVKDKIRRDNVAVALIGTPGECDEFEKLCYNTVEFSMQMPMTTGQIKERALNYLMAREREMKKAEEEKKEKEREKRREARREERKKQENQGITASELQHLRQQFQGGSAEEKKEKKSAPAAGLAFNPGKPAGKNGKKHILVVDDDPLMLRVIKRHLGDEYEVATAISGAVALKFLEKKATNLILLDYEMPGEKGPDILKKIRTDERLRNVPVVFLTGVGDSTKIQKVLGMKIQGYLLKPIDREKFLTTVKKILD